MAHYFQFVDGDTLTVQEQAFVQALAAAAGYNYSVVLLSPTASDIEITDSTKGLILKSPNGTRWRVTITDNGELVATSL